MGTSRNPFGRRLGRCPDHCRCPFLFDLRRRCDIARRKNLPLPLERRTCAGTRSPVKRGTCRPARANAGVFAFTRIDAKCRGWNSNRFAFTQWIGINHGGTGTGATCIDRLLSQLSGHRKIRNGAGRDRCRHRRRGTLAGWNVAACRRGLGSRGSHHCRSSRHYVAGIRSGCGGMELRQRRHRFISGVVRIRARAR